jgi:hypothetical protein
VIETPDDFDRVLRGLIGVPPPKKRPTPTR